MRNTRTPSALKGALITLVLCLMAPASALAAGKQPEHQLDVPILGLIALVAVAGFIAYLVILTNDARRAEASSHSRPIVIAGFLLAAGAAYVAVKTIQNSGFSLYWW